jgi:phosphatidylserine decarboxylase
MNAFEELHNKKLININDTFYIVNVFHDIQWDKNITDILLALGVTKIFHVKDPLFEENIEQNEETHAIFPLNAPPPNYNLYYNCIFFDSITSFYNCPLVSYFYVNLFTKLSFIPNRNTYIINDLKRGLSLYDTFFYFVAQFTLLTISKYCICIFAYFYKDPLFYGSFSDYPSLNAYFTRDVTHPIQINKDVEAVSPCCAIVMDSGEISTNATLFQNIKNEKIQLHTRDFSKYINLFLRPNDYHCFHAPISGKIVNIEYYQGTRNILSKNNITVINSSLIQNTKIAIHIKNDKEEMLVIAIGGFFVGSIQLLVHKNSTIQLGEKIGCFNFGSSILLLHNNSNYHLKNGFVKVFDALH